MANVQADDRKHTEKRIRKKISTEKFLKIFEENPKKIKIPQSVLDQSRGLRLMVETIRNSYDSPTPPDIEITRKGKKPKTISPDDLDPFIRNQVGYFPNPREKLLLKLLDQEATTEENAISISNLAKEEVELAKTLKQHQHIEETEDMRVYLTDLGETAAEGAKKMY